MGTASVAYEQGEKNERLLNPYPLAEPAGWVKKAQAPCWSLRDEPGEGL